MRHNDDIVRGEINRPEPDTVQVASSRLAVARAAIGVFSPAGAHARLSNFIFHRVLRKPDPLFPEELDSDRFSIQLGWIKYLFNVLPLDEAIIRLQAGTLPARAASITFDDGYADNAEIALPHLRRLGVSATFFISTAFIDGGRMWNDTIIESVRRAQGEVLDLTALGLSRYPILTDVERRAAIDKMIAASKYLPQTERTARVEAISAIVGASLPDDLMLRSGQIRDLLDAGMSIGAHTHTHPILARISIADARREITEGRELLKSLAREPIDLFAYPNGKPGVDYTREHVDLVIALGFRGAVSTARGAARCSGDPYQLPRFTPWDRTSMRFSMRMVQNFWS